MIRRGLFALLAALVVGGIVLAEDTRGTIVKVEDGSITIRTFGGFGKDKAKAEEKTFKVSKDVKISKSAAKDKDPVKLTLDELKTAAKVTNVTVTITHEGENASEIKTGIGGGFTRPMKDKKKDDKKEDK